MLNLGNILNWRPNKKPISKIKAPMTKILVDTSPLDAVLDDFSGIVAFCGSL